MDSKEVGARTGNPDRPDTNPRVADNSAKRTELVAPTVGEFGKHSALIGLSEVKALLGVGRTKVFDLIEDGQILRVKIGRRTLVPLSSVTSYIARLVENARRRGPFG